MFNLLVHADGTAWETDQIMRMDASRFGEYSGNEAASVSKNIPSSLETLERVPTLLVYERQTDGPNPDVVRYGYAKDIRLSGRNMEFRFEEEGRFTRQILEEFDGRLGMDEFEHTRTHWAVKDGGIPSEMMAKLARTGEPSSVWPEGVPPDLAKRFDDQFNALLKRNPWSKSMQLVFSVQRNLMSRLVAGGGTPQWTPFALLLAILHHGRSPHPGKSNLAAELAIASARDESTLSSLLEDLWRAPASIGDAPSNDYPLVDSATQLVLVDAVDIVRRVSPAGILSVRHVVAGLLLNKSIASPAALAKARQAGIDLQELVKTFLRHLKDTPEDVAKETKAAWQSVINGLIESYPTVLNDPMFGPAGAAKDSEAAKSAQLRLPTGSALNVDREASDDQACLDVDTYAESLAKFFREGGTGELTFALFGPWGRGKTFLMRRLGKKLKAHDYETVFFSAWKYPNVPEVWVHLYETLVEAACRPSILVVLPRIIRTGISRQGVWPLLGAIALFALSLLPKVRAAIEALGVLYEVYLVAGLGGLLWLIMFLRGVRTTTENLARDYLRTPRHHEKLGLQATIGRDLRCLLKGWMPQDAYGFGFPTVCYLALVGVVTWTAYYWFNLGGFFRGEIDSVRWLAPMTVGVCGVGLLAFVFCAGRPPKRILLVVDDLDRCTPEQVVAVVESIKLLVEEPEVSARVQVAMLIEEDVLDNALVNKYSAMLVPRELSGYDNTRIVRENREKLFTVHLRLTPLSPDDFTEILHRTMRYSPSITAPIHPPAPITVGTTNPQPRESPQSRPDAPVIPSADPKEAEPRLTSQNETPTTTTPPVIVATSATLTPTEAHFEPSEQKALSEAAARLRAASKGHPWGPRSIRSFVFRYQLARLLLNGQGVEWSPQDLVDELVKAIAGEAPSDAADRSKVSAVVRQVS